MKLSDCEQASSAFWNVPYSIHLPTVIMTRQKVIILKHYRCFASAIQDIMGKLLCNFVTHTFEILFFPAHILLMYSNMSGYKACVLVIYFFTFLLLTSVIFQIGQRHGGFLGYLQDQLSKASPQIWFERNESKDRVHVFNRSAQSVMESVHWECVMESVWCDEECVVRLPVWGECVCWVCVAWVGVVSVCEEYKGMGVGSGCDEITGHNTPPHTHTQTRLVDRQQRGPGRGGEGLRNNGTLQYTRRCVRGE